MENTNIKGINENEIDSITLNLYNYVEKIKGVFNSIDLIVDSTSDYYIGSDGDHFRAVYNLFRDNYQIVYEKISVYADALKKTQMTIIDFDKVLKSNIESQTDAEDILKKISSNNGVNIDVVRRVK